MSCWGERRNSRPKRTRPDTRSPRHRKRQGATFEGRSAPATRLPCETVTRSPRNSPSSSPIADLHRILALRQSPSSALPSSVPVGTGRERANPKGRYVAPTPWKTRLPGVDPTRRRWVPERSDSEGERANGRARQATSTVDRVATQGSLARALKGTTHHRSWPPEPTVGVCNQRSPPIFLPGSPIPNEITQRRSQCRHTDFCFAKPRCAA